MSGAVRTPPSLAERSEEDKYRRLGRAREHAGSLNIGGGRDTRRYQGTQGYTGVHRGTQGYSTQVYCTVQYTWILRGTQGYIGVHMDTQGYTGVLYTGVRFGKQGCSEAHRQNPLFILFLRHVG